MWDKVFEDSSMVQEAIKRGEKHGELLQARKQLLRLGQAKFGRPKPTMTAAIKAIQDLDRLEMLSVRLLKVDSWNALLAP